MASAPIPSHGASGAHRCAFQGIQEPYFATPIFDRPRDQRYALRRHS